MGMVSCLNVLHRSIVWVQHIVFINCSIKLVIFKLSSDFS